MRKVERWSRNEKGRERLASRREIGGKKHIRERKRKVDR